LLVKKGVVPQLSTSTQLLSHEENSG